MSQLSEVTSALISRGFYILEIANSNNDQYYFTGLLKVDTKTYPVEVEVISPSVLPKIKLLEIPDQLKPIAPHISPDGYICYAAVGSLALDVFDWAGQTLACVDRANEVLEKILSGSLITDLTDEFFAYWDGPQCILDINNINSQYINAVILKSLNGHEIQWFVLSDDPNKTEVKLSSFGYTMKDIQCAGFMVTTVSEPFPLLIKGEWPPKNVSELLMWQRTLDKACADKIIKKLKKIAQSGYSKAVILIKSPTIHYALGVIFSKHIIQKKYIKNKDILKGLYESEILPMSTSRIDDLYVVNRNQPNRKKLLGLNIVLLGCGTLGGYLSELLLKSGAGLQGGKLVLVDNEYINSGNIGRHRLGFNAMYGNKSVSLANELARGMPTANIESNKLDARELNLEQFDLIINTTGEQAFSDELSSKFNKGQKMFKPIIHCWIEGPGVAVRSFFQDKNTEACYRCLSNVNRDPLYSATKEPFTNELAGHGCESLYVPFSANVSVFAAALAAEHILDWVNGEPQPRLRTLLIDKKYEPNHLNVNPVKETHCPACSM